LLKPEPERIEAFRNTVYNGGIFAPLRDVIQSTVEWNKKKNVN